MVVSGVWARVTGAARATARGSVRVAGGLATGALAVGRTTRRATTASGAGQSGLAKLIELGAVHAVGDALVAVGLAGTLFFGVPVDEARGRVALYLLVTMAPFAVLAPLVGPALDHMRSGRRYAIAGTMALRGVLCWAMATAVLNSDSVTLFPAAFGVLVLSKAFAVSRSSSTPRLLPAEITLVTANARYSLAALIAAALAAPIGLGIAEFAGPEWVLRVATVVFIAGAVLGVRLPRHADSPDIGPAANEEGTAAEHPAPDPNGPVARSIRRMRLIVRDMGPIVGEALLASVAIRILAGFLVFFLAFLLRVTQFGDVRQGVALGAIIVAAGIGAAAGTSLGALVRSRAPQFIVLATLVVATAAVAVGAVFFGLVATVAVAFVVAVSQTLGKLAQDALVQREVPEDVRSSTFALTETFNQLAWVVGGAIGLAVSLVPNGTFGFAFIAALAGGALVVVLVGRGRRLRDVRRTRDERLPAAAPPSTGTAESADRA